MRRCIGMRETYFSRYFLAWFDVNLQPLSTQFTTFSSTRGLVGSCGSGTECVSSKQNSRNPVQQPHPRVFPHFFKFLPSRVDFCLRVFVFNAFVLRQFSTYSNKTTSFWIAHISYYFRSILLKYRVPVLTLIPQRLITKQPLNIV